MKNNYDIVIIGGGIIGTMIAYEVSKYQLKVALLEKNLLLADETSRGNSGLIHGGFDPEPHKLEAKLNLEGNILWHQEIFPKISFPHAAITSLVVAFSKKEEEHLDMLYQRGLTNKLRPEDLEIIDQAKLRQIEPYISEKATAALACYSSSVIDPRLATLAIAEVAKKNGVDFLLGQKVIAIETKNKGFLVTTSKEQFLSKVVINVAGHYADEIAQKAGYGDFQLKARRGEYRILHQDENYKVKNVLFKVPTIFGKGVIVAPTLEGKVLVGPSAEENIPKNATKFVTPKMWKRIGEIGHDLIPSLDLDKTIMTLAGSRPIDIASDDFVIRAAKGNAAFINVAGTQSPALSSAPAISKMVMRLLEKTDLKIVPKEQFINHN